MTEIEAKALALVNEVADPGYKFGVLDEADADDLRDALIHAVGKIEATEARHAAEIRELKGRFSEACLAVKANYDGLAFPTLTPFIIPAPDPLVEAVGDALEAQGMGRPQHTTPEIAEHLRAAIEARGGKIVWEVGE